MMKIATIAALVGSAAAFAPVPVSKVRFIYSGIAADFFFGGEGSTFVWGHDLPADWPADDWDAYYESAI